MQQPNDSQWQPIRNTTDHLLVAAGAGTGKTFTVVGKILFLMGVELRGERHEPALRLRDLAAITYTNQAAADLKRKLRKGLREAGRKREAQEVDLARIGTIHSFCGEILREFALRSGHPLGSRVLDEGESGALLAEVVRDSCVQALEERLVEGLDLLFRDYSVSQVEGWVAQLAGEGDRLARYVANPGSLGPRERAIVELAQLARQRLAERLRFEGAVDFDTMIVATRDLLRDDSAVRRALRRRIKVLIVDEFQDVDPVQREIAYLLGDPDSRRPDTPRLVFVGDPKQSIYRFRRADVTVWRSVERDFEEKGLGKVLPLEESFRTVAPVLGWVDAMVGPILDRPLAGEALRDFEVPFAPVRATRSDGPGDHAVEYLLVPANDEGKCRKTEEIRRIEAEAVARRMWELRRELEAELPADAPADDRKLWGQMAVLLASWSDLPIYRQALERQGIPTYPLRNSGFYERREIVDLLLALQVARDPRDDRALLGFLKSPFVGVQDETLLAIARQAKRPYWDHRGSVRLPEQELLGRGFALIERYAALRDRIPLADLLSELLQETGYLAHLALMGEDGKQPLANVRKFLQFARAHPHAAAGDLLRQIAEARDREDRVEDARLYGEQDDVVTITSIHSAKGLEWRVVFWCDLCRARRGDTDKLLLGRDTLLLGDPEAEAKEQSPEWQALRADLEQEAAAEQKRLWYVAATRAKDRLILGGLPLGKGGRLQDSPAGELVNGLPEPTLGEAALLRYTGSDDRGFEAVVRLADPCLVAEDEQMEAERPLLDPHELDGAPERIALALGRPRRSATELLAFGRCPRKHWFQYLVGLREPDTARARNGGTGMSAVVRGQVVHDVLERLTQEAELDQLLDDALERWDEGGPTGEVAQQAELRARLADEIRRVAEHPDFEVVARQPTARRELGFLYIADADQYAVGSMDLAAADGEGLVVLDVKTNEVSADGAAAVAEAYRSQRDVYLASISGISGLPVTGFGFHFSRPAVQVRTSVDARTCSEADAHFLESAAGIGGGAPALATDPQFCASCGYRAVGWCKGVGFPGESPDGGVNPSAAEVVGTVLRAAVDRRVRATLPLGSASVSAAARPAERRSRRAC